jgi:hypothetical protein
LFVASTTAPAVTPIYSTLKINVGGNIGFSGLSENDAFKSMLSGTSIWAGTVQTGFDAARLTQKTVSTWAKGARIMGRTSNILNFLSVGYDFSTGTANTSTLVNLGVGIAGTGIIAGVGIAAAPWVAAGGVVYGIISIAGGDQWLNSHFDISDKLNLIKLNRQ